MMATNDAEFGVQMAQTLEKAAFQLKKKLQHALDTLGHAAIKRRKSA